MIFEPVVPHLFVNAILTWIDFQFTIRHGFVRPLGHCRTAQEPLFLWQIFDHIMCART